MPTARPTSSRPTSSWRAAPGPILASGHLRRRDLRRAARAPRLVARPATTTADWTRRARARARSRGRWSRPTGPPVRRMEELRAGRHHARRRPARRSSTSGRTSSAALRITVRGTGRARRHPAARRGAARTASCASDPLRSARGHRPLHAARRRPGDLGAALHLPRLPLRRGRRLAGRTRRRAIVAVVCHSDIERTGLVRVLGPADQPPARERRLEHARQLPRRADRLPAARRAARLDRATSRSSRRPPASSTTAPASCTSWLRRPRRGPARTRRRARRRPGCALAEACGARRVADQAAGGWGDAAVIVPWVLYERYGDAGILAAQYDSMRALGRCASRALAGRRGSGIARLPVRRLARPGRAARRPAAARRTDPHLVATAYFSHVAGAAEHDRRSCSGTPTIASATVRSSDEAAAAFRREYVTASGRIVSDTQTAYALALRFGLLETAEQRQRAGAPARIAGAAQRLSRRHRLRRHAT